MFKNLGVGVGLRRAHLDTFLNQKPDSVSWIEVISENYMPWEGQSQSPNLDTLEALRHDYEVVLHGVSMSLGSADPLNPSYLRRLKLLVDRVQPQWISDHLCWTSVDGVNLHDLLPLPYTQETIHHLAEKIARAQDFLGQRMLVENLSSYIEFNESRMSEWEFVSEVVERADCGLLLDINNIYVSSQNHGFDPLRYLKALPCERVGQIHLAGHSRRGDLLIDTHDSPVCKEVWDLYEWSVRRFGLRSTMLERDDKIPHWNELESEIFKIKEIQDEQAFGQAPERLKPRSA